MLRQLTFLAEEKRHENRIQLHRNFEAQNERAQENPELAAALSTLRDLSDQRRRQILFINRRYAAIVLGYHIGAISRRELLGHLKVLSKNPIFVEYWQLTSEHRSFLPTESLEARIGEAVDVVMDERLDELDEWWVMGPASKE